MTKKNYTANHAEAAFQSNGSSQTVIVGAIQTIVNRTLALGRSGGNSLSDVYLDNVVSDQSEQTVRD